MKNEYAVDGDVTRIIVYKPDGEKTYTLVDTKHLKKLQGFRGRWHLEPEPRSGSYYVVANTKLAKNKWTSVRLHRWLLNAPTDKIVDHINHDILDNRECNLRLVTNLENMQNRRGAQINSKTGIRGVSWDKSKRKWRATLGVNNKHIHVGRFETIEEAEKAVKEARAKYMPYSQEALVKTGAFSYAN